MQIAALSKVHGLFYCVVVVLCTLAGPALAEDYRWTYAGYPSTEVSAGQAIVFFAEEVDKRTDGQVKFDLHHRGSLYQEEKAIEALLTGAIDFAAAGTSTIGVFTRRYDWINLPYVVSGDLTEGPVQLLRMMNSDVGKEIQAKVEEEVGLKVVFMMPSNGGARAIATRSTRLVVPDDIKKVKNRVSLAPLDMVINTQWGANPLPVPWADTLTGFSQGMFEAVQIPIPHIHNVGFDEIAKHITMVNFQYLPQVLWTTTRLWDSMPDDVKATMSEVGQEASLYEMKVDQEAHQSFREAITERGTEIIDLTPEQMKLWQDASAPVYEAEDVAKHTPPELLERLRQAGAVE